MNKGTCFRSPNDVLGTLEQCSGARKFANGHELFTKFLGNFSPCYFLLTFLKKQVDHDDRAHEARIFGNCLAATNAWVSLIEVE